MKTILVTGGTGLVGQNLKDIVAKKSEWNLKYKFVFVCL